MSAPPALSRWAARLKRSTLRLRRGPGSPRSEGDVDVDQNVVIHPQDPERLAQPADTIVLEIERRVRPKPDDSAGQHDDRGDRYLPLDPVDQEPPLEIHLRRGARLGPARDAGQLEPDGGILVGLHRPIEIAVALAVAGHERAHRGFDPA